MTDEQKSKVAELKSAIAAATTADGAPREVRVAAVSLKRELRRTGTTARELSAELGVHESTLCRWEREVGSDAEVAARGRARGRANAFGEVGERGKRRGRGGPRRKDGSPRFRMVEVTSVPATPTRPVTSVTSVTRGLRVAHAPSGLVVDGLDVETLAVLLRRMS
jgi:hypothetical protein